MLFRNETESILDHASKKNRIYPSKNFKSLTKLAPIEKPNLQDNREKGHLQSFPTEYISKNSIISIPITAFANKIQEIVNDESNYVKIPVFPKFPFGKHRDMIGSIPRFELIPKESINSYESIRNFKLEGGRIKRNIISNTSSLILRVKRKALRSKRLTS
jgi:hypothetical protein